MSKGLEAYEIVKEECGFAFGQTANGDRVRKNLPIIEKELKDYQEIREIAKRYKWDDITSKIFNVETDEKYRDLFNSAIVDIQKDYRKARAFEIIKNKEVDIKAFNDLSNLEEYNYYCEPELTQEEYDLLREVLM